MAKKSSIEKNEKRIRMSNRAFRSRVEDKKAIKEAIQNSYEKAQSSSSISDSQLLENVILSAEKLGKRKRDESPIRVRHRCRMCGRARGTYRKFGLCRMHLREEVMNGNVPGLKKASW